MAVIRPGLCSITLRQLDPEGVVDVARRAGLEGIEWGADVHVPPGDLDRAAEVGEATRAAGLVVASYGAYLRAGDPEACTDDQIDAVLDAAVALGAPNVRVWTRWGSPADATGADRAAVAGDLRRVLAAATARSLTVSLERHVGTLTETTASTLDLLGAVDQPALFTYWQPLDGVATPEALTELAELGGHLSHLHVFQWTSFEERHPLVDGDERWTAVLTGLVAADGGRWSGDRWALLEYVRGDDPAQVALDAATLRGWLDDAGAAGRGGRR